MDSSTIGTTTQDTPSLRDLKLLQFTLMSLAVQGNTLVSFHNAFGNDNSDARFAEVVRVQKLMGAELRRLAGELWPAVPDQREDWPA